MCFISYDSDTQNKLHVQILAKDRVFSREDGAPLTLWTEVGMVEGFLLTINREICCLIKAGLNSFATQEKILRYVSRRFLLLFKNISIKRLNPFISLAKLALRLALAQLWSSILSKTLTSNQLPKNDDRAVFKLIRLRDIALVFGTFPVLLIANSAEVSTRRS